MAGMWPGIKTIWLGLRQNLAVNCNGYVGEGIYPEDTECGERHLMENS